MADFAGHAHGGSAASLWVQRWAAQWPVNARVLDVACGSGRHVRWLQARGHHVTGLDRDTATLAALREQLDAEPKTPRAELIVADLEAGPWPLGERTFDAVIVTHYLWRALLPTLVASVAPGGWLIYETFAQGNASVGKPSNPDFLLRPGELLDAVRPALRVVGYEDGFLAEPARFVQRIAAVRAPAAVDALVNEPSRYPL